MDNQWFGDYPSRSFLLYEALAVTLNPTSGNTTSGNATAVTVEGSSDVDDYSEADQMYDVPLFVDYPPALLHFASACCILFILLGIPGNLITIIALFRCKKVRNATAVFIINLSVSDLMFCCFNLPLAASVFWNRAWLHGRLLCHMFPLLRYGLLAVSLFTVLAITINRYVMIGHPRLYPKLYGQRYLALMVACTWVFGFGALVATWLGRWGEFGLDRKVGSCSILPDRAGHSPKVFLFIVAFVIPCLAIVICYARIFYIVRQTALKSRANTHKMASARRAGHGRFLRAEDSALGSTSVSTSATVTSTADNNNHRAVAAPQLLCPPARLPIVKSVSAEPSSSGVDTGDVDDDNVSTRSGTPTSQYSSKRRALATMFRRGSDARSPRRPSAPPLQLAVPGKMTPKDRKLLKMILVIFASFLICYLPITISKTFTSTLDLRGLNIAGYILIYLTTCINPIIYVVMSSEYRQAYKNLLMCRSGDSGQQRA